MFSQRHAHIICLLLCVFTVLCRSWKFSHGGCPPLTSYTGTTFKLSNLANNWREIARYPTARHNEWKCSSYNIMQLKPKTSFSFSLTGVKKGTTLRGASGTINIFNNHCSRTTSRSFLRIVTDYGKKVVSFDYFIVKTNNMDYITLYACKNFLFGKIDNAMVLALPGITEEDIAAAIDSLSQYGVHRKDLEFGYTNLCL